MRSVVTFIIPVRHPDNAPDWQLLKRNLTSTIRSVAAQTHGSWQAIIVANQGSDLPELPSGFRVKWVDFPKNVLHDRQSVDVSTFRNAFRLDKGRRVLMGMLEAGETGHFMIVDDDDLVSRDLVKFVAEHQAAFGWYIENGYVWGHESRLFSRYENFAAFCGTCLIIRSDLYRLPAQFEDAADDYVAQMLGSHIMIKSHLEQAGTPLAPLPFYGAVYRVGHSGAHSGSKGLLGTMLFKKKILLNPLELVRRVYNIRLMDLAMRNEFFGGA